MFANSKVRDEKVDKVFWTIASATFVIFLGVCLAIYFTLPPYSMPFNPPATQHQLNFLKFCGVAECIICAIGFSWLASIGYLLRKVPPKIRPKIVGIYLCCGFFLVSWFPHISLHGYFSTQPWSTLAIDFSFHWTIMASAVFLGTFFYTFLKKLSGYKNHKKILSQEFYATDAFFVFSVTVVLGICFSAGLQRAMEPSIPSTPAQSAANTTVAVTEALVSAFGFAYLFGMMVLITKVKDERLKWKAIPSIICIFWLISSWWFHSRLHSKLPTLKGINPVSWILTEIFFHWVTIGAGLVVCFNMYGLIRLAEVAGKFNSKTSGSRRAHSEQSKTKSDAVDIPMESIASENSKEVDS